MSESALFLSAFPYADDIQALPVSDIDATANWYSKHFGLTEVSRRDQPTPSLVMQRDQVKMGFAINGGIAEDEGAGILVSDINRVKAELENAGLTIANWREEERDGKTFQVFFVIAPDGLCYYFHQEIDS